MLHCLILGAGAAGLHAAAFAGRGGRTVVVDHARRPAEKVRIAGGGRCNFTNMHAGPDNFLSENPHFAKSALARHTQWDFLDLVERHRIPWHEKTLGQLFCDRTSNDVVDMLLAEAAAAGAEVRLGTAFHEVERAAEGWRVRLEPGGWVRARHLIVATGGKSIPKMGATGAAYRLAERFGHRVTETRAGLVPLTFGAGTVEPLRALAGTAAHARVTAGGAAFEEALLFTHRGLSGPAILQASSYWREGEPVAVDLMPGADAFAALRGARAAAGRRAPATALAAHLPERLARDLTGGLSGNLADQPDAALRALADRIHRWSVVPTGTEGYRTAEVTLGGVATEGLDAQSMESRHVPGLYFVGECVDVTGWLGGYNFQWAWSSAHAAGTSVAARAGVAA